MRLLWRNGPEWSCFGGMGGEGWENAGEDSTAHIVLRGQDEEGRESKLGGWVSRGAGCELEVTELALGRPCIC